MILTVTLNAAMDRTLVVPNFAGGFRHRATDTYAMPGGKGVNVARTIKTLGQPVIATGFAGGGTGDRIVADLTREGILCDFVAIQAESRTSTAVLDPLAGVATAINEYGPWISCRRSWITSPKQRTWWFSPVVYPGACPQIFTLLLPVGFSVEDCKYSWIRLVNLSGRGSKQVRMWFSPIKSRRRWWWDTNSVGTMTICEVCRIWSNWARRAW